MYLKKLKSIYNAARALNGHNQRQAAKHVGKSASMINQVLADLVTSKPTITAIIDYCNCAGFTYKSVMVKIQFYNVNKGHIYGFDEDAIHLGDKDKTEIATDHS